MPCVFCGYKGEGYYQTMTHKESCPWYNVGDQKQRAAYLRQVVRSLVEDKESIVRRQKEFFNTMTKRNPEDSIPVWKVLLEIPRYF